ncbi:hypothetical protein ACFPAF_11365 [Hymenobacter endophyticus]|uniref:STAS/SEC14 domain-containing protein n=1 Tax=Hymenobacter endophyticus TaxID=3076335 RepID=A0ABU3TID4_9BACT|nr:hypothetical protein [Hymenobacter endophyticus]MDU0370995.1 hypothetical protein [Hymenobacter endophyticus]
MVRTLNSLATQWVPNLHLLRWDWQEPLSAAGFRAAFNRLLLQSQQLRVTHWLVDVSHAPVVGFEEQAWLSELWLPDFAELPVRTIALVLPTNLHNQLVVESVLADGRRLVRAEVQFFSDVVSALDWLTESDEQAAAQMEQEWQRTTKPQISALVR